MPDVFSPAKRSEVMSRIRSTGNAATELRLVALLRAAGITGWRRHVPLPLGLVPASRSSSASSSDSSSPGYRSPKSAAGPGLRSSKRAGGPGLRSSQSEGGPGLRSSQSEGGSAKGKAKARTTSASTTQRRLRVRPDFIFRAQRVAVFVDGCFWHGCPRHGTRPRQNRKFWDEKIARNRARDRLVTRRLRQRGWTVLRLWECALSPKRHPATLARLRRALGK
jgi:DNA mismatch endonuclease, patch repair protein